MNQNKLRIGFLSEMQRYPGNGWIAGVCLGIADYFEWNVKIVRLVVVGILIFSGFWPLMLIYGVLWYLMDEADMQQAKRPKWSDLPIAAAQAAGTANQSKNGEDLRALKQTFERLDERLRKMEDAALNREAALRREIDNL